MSLLSLSPLLLLLLLSASLVYQSSAFRCFSTFCPNRASVCIELCPEGITTCHAVRQTDSYGHQLVELSCTNTTCSNSSCVFERIANFKSLHYCCCTGDLCNRVSGHTDPVDPVLNVSTIVPTVPPPERPNGVLICEKYNCSQDTSQPCYHGYEVCSETPLASETDVNDHSCSSTYHANSVTGLLELRYKGCQYTPLKHPRTLVACNSSTSCHIDNPLVASLSSVYFCCCGESFCNQDVTFTHPTQVSTYGLDECVSRNCTHSCQILNHTAHCYCPAGFALINQSQCVDINECAINNGGCSEKCINVPGNYSCGCNAGRFFSSRTNRCEEGDGISCGYVRCNGTNCTAGEDEHCPTSPNTPDDLRDKYNLHFCVASYVYENGTFRRDFHGCLTGDHVGCDSQNCVLDRTLPDRYFCCCYGDLCNVRFVVFPNNTDTVTSTLALSSIQPESTSLFMSSSLYSSPTSTPSEITTSQEVLYSSIFGVLVFLMVVILISIVLGLIKIHFIFKRKLNQDTIPLDCPSPVFSDSPHFIKIIGHGRFARVFHARMMNQDVAIKIFNGTLQAKGSWTQEKDIYATERLKHENILRFICHDERVHEGQNTLWLVFDYHENGSLFDYLQLHHLTWDELFSLCLSAAAGLGHLHSIHRLPESYKPAIAHRDLKSKNILVKKDMTCCISDFGLAIKFDGMNLSLSEAKGQVGTSRYMAPEILEGAVKFDEEAFLRVDIYAFGLILWEMLSCCDISNTSSNPSYYPPFDGWVSNNPSIDEMKRVVVDEGKRPLISPKFQTNLKYSFIANIIVECWDADAEGRPTALLIMKRLLEFQSGGFTSSPPLPPLSSKASKESGFHSLTGQPLLVSTVNSSTAAPDYNINTPLPPTPTPSSPSITLSPTELKSRTVHDFSSSSTSSSSCPIRSSLPLPYSPTRRASGEPGNKKATSSLRSNSGRPTDLNNGRVGDLFSQYELSSGSMGAGDIVSPVCNDFSLRCGQDFKVDGEDDPTETAL